jgi:c-di-GMP-binding flagellar brake protein YcgR
MENRKYPRVRFERPVLWRGAVSLDNLDEARNLSEGGICLAIEELHLKIGETIQIETFLPTNAVIRGIATVKWIGPGSLKDLKCRVGLEFSDIDQRSINELRHFVGVCKYGCD